MNTPNQLPGFRAPLYFVAVLIQKGQSCFLTDQQTKPTCCPGTATNVEYNKCGGNQKFYPQKTIYDSLYQSNKTFGLYVNGTDSQHWNWTGGNDWTSGDWPYGDIQFPDAM